MTSHLILQYVAANYGCTVAELRSRRQLRIFGDARAVTAYLARDLTKESLNEIGRILGGKHHTSVLAGARRITRRMEGDADLQKRISAIRAALATNQIADCQANPAVDESMRQLRAAMKYAQDLLNQSRSQMR